MKHMMIAIALLFGGIASAQETTAPKKIKPAKQELRPEDQATKVTAKMTKELVLNANQVTQVQAINMDAAKQREAIKKEANLKPEDRKAQLNALEENTKVKFKSVLTADQYVKMEEMLKNAKLKKTERKLVTEPKQKLKTNDE